MRDSRQGNDDDGDELFPVCQQRRGILRPRKSFPKQPLNLDVLLLILNDVQNPGIPLLHETCAKLVPLLLNGLIGEKEFHLQRGHENGFRARAKPVVREDEYHEPP